MFLSLLLIKLSGLILWFDHRSICIMCWLLMIKAGQSVHYPFCIKNVLKECIRLTDYYGCLVYLYVDIEKPLQKFLEGFAVLELAYDSFLCSRHGGCQQCRRSYDISCCFCWRRHSRCLWWFMQHMPWILLWQWSIHGKVLLWSSPQARFR